MVVGFSMGAIVAYEMVVSGALSGPVAISLRAGNLSKLGKGNVTFSGSNNYAEAKIMCDACI